MCPKNKVAEITEDFFIFLVFMDDFRQQLPRK